MEKELLGKIKSRGYWRVNFRPLVFTKNKIEKLFDCRTIIQSSVVELRGWDYPHFPGQNDAKQEIYNCNDYIESWIDWGVFKEIWRFYQSTQYIHFFAALEDWYEEDNFFKERQHIKPGTSLDIVQTTFKITEVYEFLRRLMNECSTG